MFILTQVNNLENSKDNIIMVNDASHGEKYLANGYKRHERIYKMKYQHKEYSIFCPEFRNNKAGVKPVIIIGDTHISPQSDAVSCRSGSQQRRW